MSAMVTIIENAQKSGRKYLNEIESKQVLKEAGVSTTDTRLATSRDETIAPCSGNRLSGSAQDRFPGYRP